MLLQYLVGLCCLRRNPDAVDITVGDMVVDSAANKARDVDVTVTITEGSRFKAYEVKAESERLDVAAVEQLCIKLRDMPKVTDRAIISTSGFTDGAISKARTHGVDLVVMEPWTTPMREHFEKFAEAGRPDEFFSRFDSTLLIWADSEMYFITPDHPEDFTWDISTKLFSPDGKAHERFTSCGAFRDALLLRSTEILIPLEPAQALHQGLDQGSPLRRPELETTAMVPHEHEIDTRGDGVFVRLGPALVQIPSVMIKGHLQWERRRRQPEFYILAEPGTGKAFAGAAITDLGKPNGEMLGLIFAPESRDVDVRIILLEPKHKNAIRKLKIREQIPQP